jgi:hypothetical protein
MRGYGSWCIGWNEANRKSPPPQNDNNGCGMTVLALFFILLALCCFKASFDTGSPLGFLFGICVIMGFIKGLNNN